MVIFLLGMSDSSLVKKGAIPTIPAPQKKINDIPPLVPIQVKTEAEPTTTTNKSVTTITTIRKVTASPSNICRVCMSKNAEKSIYDHIEDNVTIMATLMLCAYPLQITKLDNLPKHICNPCLSKLKMAHYFRLKCLNTDMTLRKNDLEKKRKAEQQSATAAAKKSKPETPKSVVKVERGNFQKIFVKSIYTDQALERKISSTPTTSRCDDDNEIDSLDSSVLATLQGNNQFIIEERIDDVDEPKKPIKIAGKRREKWNLPKPKENLVLIEQSNDTILRSEIGEFPAEIIKSVYGNSFCLADRYLFEFGLIKQGQRNIKCVVALCPSFGQQRVYDGETADEKVHVRIPHNHPPPDENTRKKQMFFSIMKRKMQNDRSLNIRNIYEDFCKQ